MDEEKSARLSTREIGQGKEKADQRIGASTPQGKTRGRPPMALGGKVSEFHGATKTLTYGIWRNMKYRCTNPRCKQYPHYGGRGITVCERWYQFSNFLSDMGEKPEGKSLNRIDNDGPYSPENCRWADWIEQNNNTTRTVRVGNTTASHLARELGVSQECIYGRIQAGTDPFRKPLIRNYTPRETAREIKKRIPKAKEKLGGLLELAKEFGVSPQVVYCISTGRTWKNLE